MSSLSLALLCVILCPITAAEVLLSVGKFMNFLNFRMEPTILSLASTREKMKIIEISSWPHTRKKQMKKTTFAFSSFSKLAQWMQGLDIKIFGQ